MFLCVTRIENNVGYALSQSIQSAFENIGIYCSQHALSKQLHNQLLLIYAKHRAWSSLLINHVKGSVRRVISSRQHAWHVDQASH